MGLWDPFRRQRGSPEPVPRRAPPRGWRAVPPIQRTLAAPALVTGPARFGADLTAWQDPSLHTTLGHAVSADAPSGVGGGLAVAAPGGPPGVPGRGELPAPRSSWWTFTRQALQRRSTTAPQRVRASAEPAGADDPAPAAEPVAKPPAPARPVAAPSLTSARGAEPAPPRTALPAIQRVAGEESPVGRVEQPGEPPEVQRPIEPPAEVKDQASPQPPDVSPPPVPRRLGLGAPLPRPMPGGAPRVGSDTDPAPGPAAPGPRVQRLPGGALPPERLVPGPVRRSAEPPPPVSSAAEEMLAAPLPARPPAAVQRAPEDQPEGLAGLVSERGIEAVIGRSGMPSADSAPAGADVPAVRPGPAPAHAVLGRPGPAAPAEPSRRRAVQRSAVPPRRANGAAPSAGRLPGPTVEATAPRFEPMPPPGEGRTAVLLATPRAPIPIDDQPAPEPVAAATREPTAGVAVQRVEARPEPTAPVPEPGVGSAPTGPAATAIAAAAATALPAAGSTSPTEIDALVRRLYDPIVRRIKAELRQDRERAGRALDLRH